MRHELVHGLRGRYPVQRICEVLEVSRSGYYARCRRPKPARVREDRRLKQQILAVHAATAGRYGTPRVERQLRRQGIATSRKRVARLRRELGLQAKGRRRFRVTTDSKHTYPIADNRLQRRFHACGPNEVWLGDITYLVHGRRWLYLALLMDVFSRRIVGWSLSDRIDERLTMTALRRAIDARRPPPGLIHHTDRGAQYCGNAYRRALDRAGLEASMSRRGDCWDNAMAESLIKTVKTELGREFLSHQLAQRQLFEYIEGFYNTRRLHSGLDYRTPAEVERLEASSRPGLSLGGWCKEAVAPPAFAAPATASPTLT
ncbi:MAG: IS3 family transposase [bacterium]|nr:IS3 family transposase [bacterium]